MHSETGDNVIGRVIGIQSNNVEVLLAGDPLEGEESAMDGRVATYVVVDMNSASLVMFVIEVRQTHLHLDFSARPTILRCQLLGMIDGESFSAGLNNYPPVGAAVRTMSDLELAIIFGSIDALAAMEGPSDFVSFGQFAMNSAIPVKVRGKEFLRKHIAVLGNSGSGKSFTTARILQEIIAKPQAQVILFDLHGEYKDAFSDNGVPLPTVCYLGERDMVLPYWLLKYEELDRILIDRTTTQDLMNQKSFLREAIWALKKQAAQELDLVTEMTLDTPIYFSIQHLLTYALNMNDARYVLNSDRFAITKLPLRNLHPAEQLALIRKTRVPFNKGNPEGEVAHALYFGRLLGLIEQIETKLNDRRYDFLFRPCEHAAGSAMFRDVLTGERTPGDLSGFMARLLEVLTGRRPQRTNLTIIDLSGIPFDVVDLTVTVISRLMFDYNFWTPPPRRHPLLLVYEEAHNYIPRDLTRVSHAREAVERIAKEGRKYGVSAMVVSQRPNELSETLLSQCGTMVVLRISNPADQDYVRKIVSNQFGNLVDALPNLRPGEGFIIGDCVPMPLRTRIDRPRRAPGSGDFDFFRTWSAPFKENDIDEVLQYWWRQDYQLLNARRETAGAESEELTLQTQGA